MSERIDIEDLRRLEASATGGEWIRFSQRLYSMNVEGTERTDLMIAPRDQSNAADGGCCWMVREEDALLIASMRNKLPALLDELEELRPHAHRIYTIEDIRANVHALRRDCLEVLKRVEWILPPSEDRTCPSCLRIWEEGHRKDCKLGALLSKLEGEVSACKTFEDGVRAAAELFREHAELDPTEWLPPATVVERIDALVEGK